jgi:hypothetical protein
MVVDLQGFITEDEDFFLTDPAIHSTDLTRFGSSNLGGTGMELFFTRHVCTDMCRRLGLPRHELHPDDAEIKTDEFYIERPVRRGGLPLGGRGRGPGGRGGGRSAIRPGRGAGGRSHTRGDTAGKRGGAAR